MLIRFILYSFYAFLDLMVVIAIHSRDRVQPNYVVHLSHGKTAVLAELIFASTLQGLETDNPSL